MNTPRPTVVVHASDRPDDVSRAIATAARLTAGNTDLIARVIVNGEALGALLGPEPVEPADRVSVEACAFGLAGRGADPKELRPGVGTVPQAAAAVVDAQLSGAAYLRI